MKNIIINSRYQIGRFLIISRATLIQKCIGMLYNSTG